MVSFRINQETNFIIDQAISFVLLHKGDWDEEIYKRAESIKTRIELCTFGDKIKLEDADYKNLKFCVRLVMYAAIYSEQETKLNYMIIDTGKKFIFDKYLLSNVLTSKKDSKLSKD